MLFREAIVADIPQIQVVRRAVKENRLSNPALVTDQDCEVYITQRGKGWVCETEGRIVGFAIADLKEHNIWALFIDPDYEGKGIGKALHQLMMDWYFSQSRETVWLSTATGTRADTFYRLNGWEATGPYGKGETRFEMDHATWTSRQQP